MTLPAKLTLEKTSDRASYLATLEYAFDKEQALMIRLLVPIPVAGPAPTMQQIQEQLFQQVIAIGQRIVSGQ